MNNKLVALAVAAGLIAAFPKALRAIAPTRYLYVSGKYICPGIPPRHNLAPSDHCDDAGSGDVDIVLVLNGDGSLSWVAPTPR